MKRLIYLIAIAIIFLQSCVYESHYGVDGEAFLKINWVDDEPSFIDAAGAIPSNFYWNTYYKTFPGFYTVYYEYERSSSMGLW